VIWTTVLRMLPAWLPCGSTPVISQKCCGRTPCQSKCGPGKPCHPQQRLTMSLGATPKLDTSFREFAKESPSQFRHAIATTRFGWEAPARPRMGENAMSNPAPRYGARLSLVPTMSGQPGHQRSRMDKRFRVRVRVAWGIASAAEPTPQTPQDSERNAPDPPANTPVNTPRRQLPK
jgi:hypothetical protein